VLLKRVKPFSNGVPMSSLIKWLMTKASRDTTSGQFIAEIDGLRFIAIFSVIFYHLAGWVISKTGRGATSDPLAEFFSHGSIGVQLFFVISGFVIALPFAKWHLLNGKPPQIRQYFFRRLTRLEPPYIINLLFRFIVLALITADTVGELLPHLIASMGYIHNLIYGDASKINCVAWSLEVELQFYILAPFITNVFMIRTKNTRRLIFVLFIAFFSILSYEFIELPRYNLSVFAAAQFFLTGFLLVDIFIIEWNQNPIKSLRWDVISFLSWLAICLLVYQGRFGEIFLVIPIFTAYFSAFKGVLSNRFFCHHGIYVIGGMCYTFYLYHYSVITAMGRLLIKFEFFNQAPIWLVIITACLLIVPVTMLFCTFMFILVEKPCMKKDWHIKLFERYRFSLAAND
jgi:peptidoglycan/LPS O-acetylase OafA/YrhL